MKFSVDKDELLKWFGLLSKAIPNRTTIDIFKTVLVEAKDNQLNLRTTNSVVEITVNGILANVEEPGVCCIGDFVFKVLSSFPGGEVSFSKKKKLTVKQEKRTHRFTYMDPDEFPVKLEIDNYSEFNPRDFTSIIKRCWPSLSDMVVEKYYSAYCINPHSDFIVSTNGFCATMIKNVGIEGNISLPSGNILNSIIPFIDNDLELSVGQLFGIRSLDWEVVVNSIDSDFTGLAVVQVFESLIVPDLIINVKKDDLLQALDICQHYFTYAQHEGLSSATELRKEGNEIHLIMEIKSFSDVDEIINCEADGLDKFSVSFNNQILREAIQVVGDDIELQFFEEKDVFLVLDKNDSDYIYMQGVMKVK